METRKRRETQAYQLAREGEFTDDPGWPERVPFEDDDPEPWWDMNLEEAA